MVNKNLGDTNSVVKKSNRTRGMPKFDEDNDDDGSKEKFGS